MLIHLHFQTINWFFRIKIKNILFLNQSPSSFNSINKECDLDSNSRNRFFSTNESCKETESGKIICHVIECFLNCMVLAFVNLIKHNRLRRQG